MISAHTEKGKKMMTIADCENCNERCPKAEMAHEIALGRMYATNELVKLVKKIESGQLVEVVRCWECKHHRDKNEQEQQYLVEDILICTSPDATDDCWNAVWPNHFCSYGEWKEGVD